MYIISICVNERHQIFINYYTFVTLPVIDWLTVFLNHKAQRVTTVLLSPSSATHQKIKNKSSLDPEF